MSEVCKAGDTIPVLIPIPFNQPFNGSFSGNHPGSASTERVNVQEISTPVEAVSIPVLIPLPPGLATKKCVNIPETPAPSLIPPPQKKSNPSYEQSEESGWQELQHPRKPVSPLRNSPQWGISKETLHQVFMNNSRVSGKATAKQYLQLNMPEIMQSVIPFLNKGDAIIFKDSSDSSQQIDSSGCSKPLFTPFHNEYVHMIDEQMQNLMKVNFRSVDHAVISLNIIIRSYLSGFCVHRKGSYKRVNEDSKTFVLECHTQNHMKVVSSCRCPWKAVIRYDDNGAKFERIDSFILHGHDCYSRDSELTPNEVKLRHDIPSNQLNGVMQILKQQKFGKKAIHMRNFRARLAAEAMVDKEFIESLVDQPIYDFISNKEQLSVEPDEEVKLILRYLSSLYKEGVESFVTFGQSDASTRTDVTSINMLWNEGRSLLSTHSDVIFCDSMWNVSQNGYYVFTIVVIDENYDLRLAAMSFVSRERKDAWKSFFEWVKKSVPSFSPKCIVTDGALYINNGFREAVGKNALHIVCWWHQRENVLKKIGIKKELGRVFLQMAYASTKKQLNALIKKANAMAENDVEISAKESFKKLLTSSRKTALIILGVFTGGTITNSYSESINNLLRKAGLDTKNPMLTILRFIHNFSSQHNCRPKHVFVPSKELSPVIGEDVIKTVTAGALCRFKKKVNAKIKHCEVVEHDGTKAVIRERIVADLRLRVRFRSEITHRKRFQMRRFSRVIRRIVVWPEGKNPVCSCNSPVYSGIPCAHVVLCGIENGRKIPLECFHKRFYKKSRDVAADAPVVCDDESQPCGNDDSSEEVPEEEHENQSVEYCMEEVMEENTMQDQEGCTSTVDGYSECKLEITDAEEVRFYAKVYKLSVDLTELYASPEHTDYAKNLANWLTVTSDGIVLGCTGSAGAISVSETKIMTSVRVNYSGNPDPELIEINNDLHITESYMNSSYVSEEMCEFRGKLSALLIKLILIRRLNPLMVSGLVDQFERRVTELTRASCVTLRTRTAGLKPVSGSLRLDSFASSWCR